MLKVLGKAKRYMSSGSDKEDKGSLSRRSSSSEASIDGGSRRSSSTSVHRPVHAGGSGRASPEHDGGGSAGSRAEAGGRSSAQTPTPSDVAAQQQLAELQLTALAQKAEIVDLRQTVQDQHKQVVEALSQVEALKSVVKGFNGGSEPAPVESTSWWGLMQEDQTPRRPPLTVSDAAAISMGQIIQQLHEAQDRCSLQDEEVHQLEAAVEKQECVIKGLQREKEKLSKLVQGLKRELHHYKHLVREQKSTHATMEVELERTRLEKKSITRLLSTQCEDGAPGSIHEAMVDPPDSVIDPVSPVKREYSASVMSACDAQHLHDLETTPERSCPSMHEMMSPSEVGVNGVGHEGEVQALQAELSAAKEMALRETKRLLELEQELEQLRAAYAKLSKGVPVPETNESESEASESTGGELALLVLKEQLQPLRDLNVRFQSMWEPCTTEFKVRGKTYMSDGVKVEGGEPLFELMHMEIFYVDLPGQQRADHITALFRDAEADSVYQRCCQASRPPFLLVVNFQVPGNPPCSVVVYLALSSPYRQRLERLRQKLRSERVMVVDGGEEVVAAPRAMNSAEETVLTMSVKHSAAATVAYYTTGPSSALLPREGSPRPEDGGPDVPASDSTVLKLFAEFLEGSDDYRDSRLKLIPAVVEGPMTVRWGVGNKPVVLGKKITQRYFCGPGYMEVDVDIGSSSIASTVLGTIREYSKNIVIDTALVLQGESEAELPERILGGMRFNRVEFKLAQSLEQRLRMSALSPKSSTVA